jgi:carbamoylphosphate synthase small subunit
VPSFYDLLKAMLMHFKSSFIHIMALVVGYYSEDFSHFLIYSLLSIWLKENNVLILCSVNTHAFTKCICTKGVIEWLYILGGLQHVGGMAGRREDIGI